jgi:hypothetical protein
MPKKSVIEITIGANERRHNNDGGRYQDPAAAALQTAAAVGAEIGRSFDGCMALGADHGALPAWLG